MFFSFFAQNQLWLPLFRGSLTLGARALPAKAVTTP